MCVEKCVLPSAPFAHGPYEHSILKSLLWPRNYGKIHELEGDNVFHSLNTMNILKCIVLTSQVTTGQKKVRRLTKQELPLTRSEALKIHDKSTCCRNIPEITIIITDHCRIRERYSTSVNRYFKVSIVARGHT